MKKLLLLSFILTSAFTWGESWAQERSVSGKVTSIEDGSPLPGVNVVLKGTTTGTVTDIDGNYKLSVPSDGGTLVFSFIGLSSETVEIGTKSVIDIQMSPDVKQLSEVVVVAYGEQTRQSITGSVDVVSSEELQRVQTSNVVQSMIGKVAGVQIVNDSGQPGDAPTVRFRGIGSISSGTSPLYVVDGIPFNGNINSLSPQDIESMTFLKDASANALYGSRGANGVIIITTKKGRKKGTEITFDAKYGVNDRAVGEYDIITDPGQYYEVWYDRIRIGLINSGVDPATAAQQAAAGLISGGDAPLGYNIYTADDDQIIDPATGKLRSGLTRAFTPENWGDELFSPSTRQEYHLGIRANADNLSTYFSLGYLDDEGYALNSGFSRLSTRLSMDYNATDWLDFGGSFNYAYTDQDAPNQNVASGTYSNAFSWARNIAPIYPIYAREEANKSLVLDENGNRVYDFGEANDGYYGVRPYGAFNNPVATSLADQDENVYHNISTRLYTKIKFLKDFSLTLNVAGDIYSGEILTFATPIGGDAKNANGRLTQARSNSTTLATQQLLNWGRDFGDHNVSVLLGHESNQNNFTFMNAQRTELAIGDLPVLDNTSLFQSLRGYERDYKVEGYFGRILYNYNNKYFLNANYRRDGSSVFAPDYRWGNFYGLGAAWVITEEGFMKGLDFLNNLKLKASYGQQGNDLVLNEDDLTVTGDADNRNYYPYKNQFRVVTTPSGQPGIQIVSAASPELQWETSKTSNIGMELAALDNRLRIGVDYWKRLIDGNIFFVPSPLSYAALTPSIPVNAGEMVNVGWDIMLSGDIIRTEDLTWSLDFNTTTYKNEILDLPGEEPIDDPNSTRFRWEEGKSRYDYYMRQYAGIDPETGDALWWMDVTDANGDPTGEREKTDEWNDANEYYVGKTAIPDFYGGFSTSLAFKGIDLNIGFAYQLGGYGYDNVYQNLMQSAGDIGQNYHKDVMNSWTPENQNASIPRLDIFDDNQSNFSDYWLVSSDYLSIQNITLGYTLPTKLAEAAKLTSVRIYVSANNVYLWSKRDGYDPRLDLTGQTLNEYSVVRSTSVGLTLKL